MFVGQEQAGVVGAFELWQVRLGQKVDNLNFKHYRHTSS